MYLVIINDKICTGCGECADICPVDIISMKDKKAFIEDNSDCLGCESCMVVCLTDAVSVKEVIDN